MSIYYYNYGTNLFALEIKEFTHITETSWKSEITATTTTMEVSFADIMMMMSALAMTP